MLTQEQRERIELYFRLALDYPDIYSVRENAVVRDAAGRPIATRYAVFEGKTLKFAISSQTYEQNKQEIEELLSEIRAAIARDREEARANRRVVEIARDYETGRAFYAPSGWIPAEEWGKIEKYMFKYRVEDSSMCSGEPIGWAIQPDAISTVEELLGIAHGKRIACSCEVCNAARLQEQQREQERKRRARRRAEIESQLDALFLSAEKPEDCSDIEQAEQIKTSNRIVNYYLSPTYLWQVIDNSADGDDWSLNNYLGSIARRIALTDHVRILVNEYKNLTNQL